MVGMQPLGCGLTKGRTGFQLSAGRSLTGTQMALGILANSSTEIS